MKRRLLATLLLAFAIIPLTQGCSCAAPVQQAPAQITLPDGRGSFTLKEQGPRGQAYTGTYNHWSDCVLVTNGKLSAIVVPQISRVMYFGPAQGPNMLWENPQWFGKTKADLPADYHGYQNFGGWKLWTKPWLGWPPVVDGLPGKAQVNKDGSVTVSEQPSEKAGVQIVWTVGFEAAGDLRVDCTFINTSASRKEYQVWSVIQTRADKGFWLLPATAGDKPYTLRPENPVAADQFHVADGVVAMRNENQKSHWVGTNPDRGWVAYARPSDSEAALLVCAYKADRNWKYGDGVSTVVYNNPLDAPEQYTEIEGFSPVGQMGPAEEEHFTMRWSYVTAPAKVDFAGDLKPLVQAAETASH